MPHTWSFGHSHRRFWRGVLRADWPQEYEAVIREHPGISTVANELGPVAFVEYELTPTQAEDGEAAFYESEGVGKKT